jgi:hypothetical protein
MIKKSSQAYLVINQSHKGQRRFEMREIVLKGDLESRAEFFGKHFREITFYGLILYGEEKFFHCPVLRLLIEDVSFGGHGDEAKVSDFYSPIIPYLKPIQSFRDLLQSELTDLVGWHCDKLQNPLSEKLKLRSIG